MVQHADLDHTGLTGVGSVASDPIFDAKGDLAVGTGANTSAKLTAGANDTILMAESGEATGLKWVAAGTPTDQDYDDVAAVGTSDTFARGDHLHGMPSASEGGAVPGWVARFIGTTDATHFYWDGNDLAGFTEQTVTGTSTWSESQNLVSALMTNQTSDDVSAKLIAQTFSTGDTWEVAVNLSMLSSDVGNSTTGNRSIGICFTDGTTTSSNVVAAHFQVSNDGTSVIMVGRHGTMTAIATAPWVSIDQGDSLGGWLWIQLKYSASNTFQAKFSTNGIQYSAFGEADISKTMTPSYVGICGWQVNAGETAVMTWGPLLKTA